MLRYISFAALAAALVTVGCDQSPVEPVEKLAVSEPALDFLNGPAQPGPYVVRYEDGTVLIWTFDGSVTPDGESWAIMFGIDDVANMKYCGGPGSAFPIAVQDIPRDEHFNRMQGHKRTPAFAGHTADVFAYDWCDRMDVPWIATGEASVVWSANIHGSEGNSLNSARLAFNAWLSDLSTGGSYHAHYNQVWEWPPFAIRTQKQFIK